MKLILQLIVGLMIAFSPITDMQAQDNTAPKLAMIGDSYVANHKRPKQETWHYLLAKEMGLGYQNLGRNGGCVAFDRTKEGFGVAIRDRIDTLQDDARYIILIAGHNDAFKCANSPEQLQVFRDSLDHLLTYLEHRCPKAHIGYVTPWYVDKPGFAEVCKTIRQVCKQHRVPVLNNYRKKAPVKVRDDAFRGKYFQSQGDHAHLNAQGHQLFLPYAEKWFKKNLMR